MNPNYRFKMRWFTSVTSNLDIYSEVGANAALVKSYAVTVSDGQLNIEFRHVIENPEISAIEVISTETDSDPEFTARK